MNVIDELKKLAAEATTEHVKALLEGEIAKVEAEAKAAAESLHAKITGALEHLGQEVAALWEKIRKVL